VRTMFHGRLLQDREDDLRRTLKLPAASGSKWPQAGTQLLIV
jgi:hypothetical protein